MICNFCGDSFENVNTYKTHKRRNKFGECKVKRQKNDAQKILSGMDPCEILNATKDANDNKQLLEQLKKVKQQNEKYCEENLKQQTQIMRHEVAQETMEQLLNEKVEIIHKMHKKHEVLIETIKKQKLKITRPVMCQTRRQAIAASQAWKCKTCFNVLDVAYEIDHIKRWADSYDDSNTNLQALCPSCHKVKTAEENTKLVFG